MHSSNQRSLKSFCFLFFFVIHIDTNNCFVTNNVRVPRETTSGDACLLPLHPKFGQWTAYRSTSSLHPGAAVPLGTVLLISCQSDYKLEGDTSLVCINGRWTAEIGQCLKKCRPLVSTAITQITCTNCNKKEINCTEAVDGSIAQFKCADFYETSRPLFHSRDHVTCLDGKWSDDIPECVPVCGQMKVKSAPTLIVNGSVAAKNSYPWQVALYNVSNKVLLCGGTLLNQRVILTAAHCVTDDLGKLLPKDIYMVAVGKYYREFQDHRDIDQTQFSAIQDMFIPRQYRGYSLNYLGDIALLVTNKTFFYSYSVQPICVDWESKYQSTFLNATKQKRYAYISGWGYTSENSGESDVLQQLKVPLISEDECLDKLPDDNEDYLTYDKLCAGYLKSGTSACKGDSGGGLVFRHKRRHYLIAIVSISPQDPSQIRYGCNSQQYTLYTKISEYIEDFILQKEARIRKIIACEQDPECKDVSPATPKPLPVTERPLEKKCILPQHPNFGRWSVLGAGSELEPGMSVQANTILKISCSKNHKLLGSGLILCINGSWSTNVGQCSKTCPPLFSTFTLTVTCTYQGKELNNCTEPADGTLVKYQCAPFYELSSSQRTAVHICLDGSWDLPTPTCVPVCGRRKVVATPLLINGTPTPKSSFPWHVALYRNKEKLLICGASMISPRVVLTAATCVTDTKGKLYPKEDFTVAAGKYYRQYNDSRDFNDAQFSSVHAMFIPSQYKGAIQNFFADIALLVTKETFTLSSAVQPVCIDYGQNYNLASDDLGYMAGWGFTLENEAPSEVLKKIEVPFISSQQCSVSLPEDFEAAFTRDKFCAGYLNGTSLCRGDTGGGLVVKHDGRFYITGISSVSPASPISDRGCDSYQYGLYTKISDYLSDFIIVKEAEFRT